MSYHMSDAVGYHMSSTQHADKDELFVCPFDPVHRVSAKRFVYHIVKCRKQHPHLETATCPFNARHIVLKPELRHHMSICPDKRLIEIELNRLIVSELPNDQSTITNDVLDFQNDEDWSREEEERVTSTQAAEAMQNGFSGMTIGKKVNARREAIKKLKQEMRQKAEENGCNEDYRLRRPFARSVDVLDSQHLPLPTGLNVQKLENKEKKKSESNTTSSFPISARSKAKLAANFNIAKDSVPAIGRGRRMREMQMANSKLNGVPVSTSNLAEQLCDQSPAVYALGRGKRMSRENLNLSVNNLQHFTPPGSAAVLPAPNTSENPAECTDWGQDELAKKERKLMKLLKQIEALEKKSECGILLDKEQKEKVEKKESIQKSLQDIKKKILELSSFKE